MSNDAIERLWKLQTQVGKLVMDGLRDPARVADKLQEILEERQVVSCKFSILADLGLITAPADYDHVTCLTKFMARNRKKFYGVDENITDVNFSNPSRILKPGDKLHVRVIHQIVPGTTTSTERLDYLRQQPGNQFVGAQGLSLVFDQKRDQLPKGKWHSSFDELDRLWKGADGYRRVPGVGASSGGGFRWNLGGFEYGWDGGDTFLSFCDLPAGEAGVK